MPGHDARRQFERFAIAGGMPRYLTALSGEDALADVICDRILDRNAGLWDEGRRVLEQELREPKVYFAVLQCLASGDKESGEIASALRSDAQRISKYLNVLTDMRLIERRQPIESVATGRSGHWHLRDAFTRFWFRFVFPSQDDLEAGLSSRALYNTEVAPVLSDHIAPEFEEFCRRCARVVLLWRSRRRSCCSARPATPRAWQRPPRNVTTSCSSMSGEPCCNREYHTEIRREVMMLATSVAAACGSSCSHTRTLTQPASASS